ncbi:MAG: lactate utilization protein [Thermoplasmata archaeon]|nr:lactate utilization protein [Thermoplasmata archaeon]
MTETEAFEGVSAAMSQRIRKTFHAMNDRGITAAYVPTGKQALAKLLELIPKGAAVAHGTSTTLEQIGFLAALKDPHTGYRYVNEAVKAESDPAKRALRRGRLFLESDFFLGSVQAVCETGEAIGCDAGGSRQAFYVFGPPHVIWVAGINKFVANVTEGIRRAREVALPLEDQRMKGLGAAGSYIGKLVIYERDRPGRITLILIGESLGF